MSPFSVRGYLLFTLWAVVLTLASSGWRLIALVVLELLFGLAWSPAGLRPLRRLRFWVFIVTALALGPFLTPQVGLRLDAVSWSWSGMSLGLDMAGRALSLTLAFSLGLSALSLSDLVALFDRLHLRGLGFALGVAMNLLKSLQEMATVTYETIELRGGRRRPLVALRLFLVTLVSNTLRYGDQIVQAAAVRAFDPDSDGSPTPSTVRCSRADVGLLCALVASGLLLLALPLP
ncbi:MAG: energy-coupling factor transporter transmembrane component T [Chloroflexota bacterium]